MGNSDVQSCGREGGPRKHEGAACDAGTLANVVPQTSEKGAFQEGWHGRLCQMQLRGSAECR